MTGPTKSPTSEAQGPQEKMSKWLRIQVERVRAARFSSLHGSKTLLDTPTFVSHVYVCIHIRTPTYYQLCKSESSSSIEIPPSVRENEAGPALSRTVAGDLGLIRVCYITVYSLPAGHTKRVLAPWSTPHQIRSRRRSAPPAHGGLWLSSRHHHFRRTWVRTCHIFPFC